MKIRVSVLGLILSILATTGIATANSLVQMDVRKSGSDALNMTFMTSESDAGNVIVRKKSDNKYVLLIPKVSSENYKSQILSSSVREVVSDVDVKNVDDGANGYTKVTLITTKPLEISATTKKAVAGDNKEYKNVLANAPKQAATTTPLVAKTASATPAKNIKQVAAMTKPAVSTAKPTVTKTEQKPTVNKTTTAPKPNTVAPKQEVKPAVKETKPVTQAKPAVQTPVTQAPTAPVVPATPTPVATQQPVQTQAPAVAPTSTQQTDTPKPATGNRAGDKLISAGLFLGAILAILAFFLKVIKSLAKTNNQRFDAAFANQPKPQQPNSYNEITEDTDLNWQEKYQKFLGETERQPEQARRGNGNYQFITANDEVEEKRQSLERLLEPETVPTVEEDEITFIDNDAYAINEEDFIGKSLKREFKLKAFANPLSDAKRNRIEKIIEEATLDQAIESGNSSLLSNIRSLNNANLNANAVTGKKIPQQTEYIMSSVDEFFSILDREDAARAVYKKATNPLASGLSKIKLPGQGQVMATATGVNKAKKSMPKTAKVAHVTNPVDEIAVKSAYDINEDSGFYIVNHEGTQALIGKINEEIFVLKKFDAPVDGELQVRRDKDNVYMVKAPGFKSLVEVNGSKMGVLVEL